MVSISPSIAKALTSMPALTEKLISQLSLVNSQLSQALTSKSGGGHNKNSESARSMNEIGNDHNAMQEAAGGGGGGQSEGQSSRNAQLAMQMKELMEIFQSLVMKGSND